MFPLSKKKKKKLSLHEITSCDETIIPEECKSMGASVIRAPREYSNKQIDCLPIKRCN